MPETANTNEAPQKPDAPASLVGLTKRQQLKQTNKNIFVWVAGAAVVLSFSIVALQFIVRQGLFNNKIITEQQATNKALDQSKANFSGLKHNVDALLADNKLAALRANPSDSSLQVVLDALPTTGDPTTFSNSLYNKILSRQGVTISGVNVGSVGVADGSTTVAPEASGSGAPQPLVFGAAIAGSPDQIRLTLLDIEKVIRPIVVRQLNITVNGALIQANIEGETYYLPRSTVSLGDKSIKP